RGGAGDGQPRGGEAEAEGGAIAALERLEGRTDKRLHRTAPDGDRDKVGVRAAWPAPRLQRRFRLLCNSAIVRDRQRLRRGILPDLRRMGAAAHFWPGRRGASAGAGPETWRKLLWAFVPRVVMLITSTTSHRTNRKSITLTASSQLSLRGAGGS